MLTDVRRRRRTPKDTGRLVSTRGVRIWANPVFHELTKYIEIDCHFIREKIQEGLVKTEHISSGEQLVDVLTKHLKFNNTVGWKYLEDPCVWVESNTTTLNILSSHAEIGVGFLLIVSSLSTDRNKDAKANALPSLKSRNCRVEQSGRYNGFPAPRRPGPQHSTLYARCYRNGSPVECHTSPPPPSTMATTVTRRTIIIVGRRNCPCHH
ncbi:late embryoproteinsis abundant protein D-34-like [Hibiscus syriacus]|uniref:Late embryoproteinsis abundant protein D-34-like n=1 Tax=Hibiscus syriacus TaxID=106335 RepID=A0A6A2Z1Y6_HIBSY|nr:late embryoproteinsis abundant protein D-34-like [Hibiscus syriacus]